MQHRLDSFTGIHNKGSFFRIQTSTSSMLSKKIKEGLWRFKGTALTIVICAAILSTCGIYIWTSFTPQAWITISVVALLLVLLISGEFDTSLMFASTVFILVITEVITLNQGLEGFGDPTVIAIALLYMVSKGVQNSGLLKYAVWALGRPKSLISAKLRLMIPLALISMFFNNTPVILMW